MKNNTKIINILKKSGVGVMPTDTIYGLVGSVFFEETVERVYKIKKRDRNKPLIVLISSINDLNKLGVKIEKESELILEKIWPGEISVVLPFENDKIKYLNKKENTLAIRFPNDEKVLRILEKTGPLIATSVNLEGENPAENITEAKKYFGDNVDFYLDGGELKSSHSTLIEMKKEKIKILRKGGVDILSINDKIKNIHK